MSSIALVLNPHRSFHLTPVGLHVRHQMKRISRARFTQTQTGGQTVARKRTGWLVGSEGVPWLQPPEFGHKIGMAGKVGPYTSEHAGRAEIQV